MENFRKLFLQQRKIQVCLVIVILLWGLALGDKLGGILAWETFLPEISGKADNSGAGVKELLENCQGEDVTEYYEGTGITMKGEKDFLNDIKVSLEQSLKAGFPDESWEIVIRPKEQAVNKRELYMENDTRTISGKVRIFTVKEDKETTNYVHFGFTGKNTETSLYILKEIWGEKMKEVVKDYRDYYYRTLCFSGKLTDKEQKQAARQYLQYFGAKKVSETVIEDMENVYGYTDKIQNSVSVEQQKINIHIAFAYEEEQNKTRLYLATPFLNTDY